MFQENCYVINDETNECVIIDCGVFYEEEKKAIYDYVIKNKLTPKHLLTVSYLTRSDYGLNLAVTISH